MGTQISFRFQRLNGSRSCDVEVHNLIIAGWTGRDQAALEAHIKELEELGIAPPKRTPMFYRLSASLLTAAPAIQVIGGDSSGEVEFVLLKHQEELWVGVGSDHTDRKVEALGVTLSKQMCPKPLAPEMWALADVEPHWDELILRSYTISDGKTTLYQEGKVSAIRAPREILKLHVRLTGGEMAPGTAMFCGTFSVIGGIRSASTFGMEIEDPVLGRRIVHSYHVEPLAIEG
ncbi:MAG: DUF2848 domain-containing protein [Bryobacteraceae bacterium]